MECKSRSATSTGYSNGTFNTTMNRRMAKMLATALFAAALTRGDEEDVVYRVDRTFDPTDTTIGDATVFNIVNSASTNLTGIIIGQYSITTNGESATEREGVSWGQVSTTQAWHNVTNALTIGSYTNIFDDPGWIKGVKSVVLNGDTSHGAYMWWLQNTLEFTTPGSTYWTNAGRTYLLENVLVGTLGDYAPGTQYTETFPTRDDPDATNWPGCPFLTSEMPASNQTVKYSFRTDTYYRLCGLKIRRVDGGPAPKVVPYDEWEVTSLRAVVTPDQQGDYEWAPIKGGTNIAIGLITNGQTVAVSVKKRSTALDDFGVQVVFSPLDSCRTAEVAHTFTAVEVVYSAAEDQLYGFDSTTNPPWKSVAVDDWDSVIGILHPSIAGLYTNIYYCSTDPGTVTCSPTQSTATIQSVVINGQGVGTDAEIKARCESTAGQSAGDLNIWCRQESYKTLKIIVVNDSEHGVNADPDAISIPAITQMLNSVVYNQAVLHWIVDTNVAIEDVSYDSNADGLQLKPYSNPEISAIITNCADPEFDVNVFVVKAATNTNVVGWAELLSAPQTPETAFIFTDPSVTTLQRAQAIAHEIGHAAFGLIHIADTNNVMYEHLEFGRGHLKAGTHLRHSQWQMINPDP